MRAMGANREHFGTAAHHQDLFAAGLAEQLAAIGNIGKGNALRQVGTGEFSLFLRHFCPR